mgnify:CR=1 FL=1
MPKGLKTLFLVHGVVSLVFGLPLLIIPGRLLTWVGWAPIDPIAGRLLGAVMLALAWGGFRGWLAEERAKVAILVELEAVYTVLACVGLLRHLLVGSWPLFPWLVFALHLGFALAWVYFLLRRK